MKPRHAAALALVGWYLMVPPITSSWPVTYDTSAPLSKWKQGGSFDTAKECNEEKEKTAMLLLQSAQNPNGTAENKQKFMQSMSAMLYALQCIATDDPRLKGHYYRR
jgi:hypothetical protein